MKSTMWILPIIGYLGMAVGFSLLTLAIASGLYYLSEMVEEHTKLAKLMLTRLIYFVIILQALLFLIDGFPAFITLLGIACHLVYLGNMRRFPVVKLSDPLFILSCILVLAHHYICFQHFSALPRSVASYHAYTSGTPPSIPTFTEIASYFGLCVWLVPFALFVSLSASDNVLPTMGSEGVTGKDDQKKKRAGGSLIKAVVDGFRNWVGDAGNVLGWWKRDRDGFL